MPIEKAGFRKNSISQDKLAFNEAGSRQSVAVSNLSREKKVADLISAQPSQDQYDIGRAIKTSTENALARIEAQRDVFSWEINSNHAFTNGGATNILTFGSLLHDPHSRLGSNNLIVTTYNKGIWQVSCWVLFRCETGGATQTFTDAELWVLIDGQKKFLLDKMDAGVFTYVSSGHGHSSIRLNGTRVIPLEYGETLSFGLVLRGGANSTANYDESIIGYADGHRVKCNDTFNDGTTDPANFLYFI